MKYSDIICIPPSARLIRLEAAAAYVAGEQNLKGAVQAGWFKPVVKHKGCTAYDVRDLDVAIDRAKLDGEWPKCQPARSMSES